jgi:hypothetical protein
MYGNILLGCINFVCAFLLLLSTICRTSSFQQGFAIPSKIVKGHPHCYNTQRQIVLHSTREITIDRGYGYFTSPFKLASSPYWMDDYMEENDFDVDISYLPLDVYNLPPTTEHILQRVTKTYIESDVNDGDGQDEVKLFDVLETIDLEYKYATVPLTIGSESIFSETRHPKQEKSRHIVSKVLSFAALHRLPAEVAIFLFGELASVDEDERKPEGMDSNTAEEIRHLLIPFHKHGWNSITFSQGLSLRIKRNFVTSRINRYSPWPRKSVFTRSQDAIDAEEALQEAKRVQPPMKLVRQQVTVEEIDEMAFELNVQSELSQQTSIKDMLTFFPNRNNVGNRLIRMITKQKDMIRTAGRAGLISYGILTFVWYTCVILWQWHRLSVEGQNISLVQGKIDALRRSLQKFSKVFISTYFHPRLTKLKRLTLAVALSPVGNRALEWTQKRFKISADQAMGAISSILVASSLGIWIIMILGDVTFSQSSLGTFAM